MRGRCFTGLVADRSVVVVDNPEESRFEARVDGVFAGAAYYRDRQERRLFVHTEVQPEFGGHGVGSALARFALERAQADERQVVPLCPFIERYIKRHDEFTPLVDEETLRQMRS